MHIGWDLNMRDPRTIAAVVALYAFVIAVRIWRRVTS
jgi:hypothetical protein